MRNVRSSPTERRDRQRFERLVRKAVRDGVDLLPAAIRSAMLNYEIVIEEEPSVEQRGNEEDGPFGLYEGIPLTERTSSYGLILPDKITIFRGPLQRATNTPSELFAEVRATVIHEVAHHFGMDEWQIAELGYE